MILQHVNGRFVAACAFVERTVPKAAGFRWDAPRKEWYTTDATVAARLIEYADSDCHGVLADVAARREATLAASRATNASGNIPAPEGLEYMPFQRAGISFASSRKATLVADEMGLGKTIQAIGLINADESIRRVLVVCPASLRLNWHRELKRWSVRPCHVEVATTSYWPHLAVLDAGNVLVVITNWDIAAKLRPTIDRVDWDLVVIDEAHYGKNPQAKRTKAVFGVEPRGRGVARTEGDPGIEARRKLALTGTPITNRPAEIFPVLRWLDSKSWPAFFPFGKRYSNGFRDRYGWNFTGASNLGELQDRLRSTIMVRRLKSEVLTELPAKRRQVIEVPANGAQGVVDAENAAWEAREERLEELRARVELAKASDHDYEAAVAALRDEVNAAFSEISRFRHDTALAKAPHVGQHVVDVLEGGTGKVVVMAHHHDVVAALREALKDYDPAVLTGETPMAQRQAEVDRFQQDPACPVFIGSIMAAGVGLTLTAAAHVVFAELDWVPGNVTQAEDRCHRIGQTDSVLVQHLVLEGSLDARMAHTLVAKQRVIDQALDVDHAGLFTVPSDVKEKAATEAASRARIVAEAASIDQVQAEAIHAGLRALAAMCDGAHQVDGSGFSKIDVRIGHSLAHAPRLSTKQAALGRRLIVKYRRQLADDLVAAAKGAE